MLKIAITHRANGSKAVIDTEIPEDAGPEVLKERIGMLVKRVTLSLEELPEITVSSTPAPPPPQAPEQVAPARPVAPATLGQLSAFHAKCNDIGIRHRKVELLQTRAGKIDPKDLSFLEMSTLLDQLSAVQEGKLHSEVLFQTF
jgi:hypothetical protein